MADLTKTAAQVRMGMAVECRLIPMIAGEAIDKGELVYRATDGDANLAQANAAATTIPVGFATTDAAAGEAFEALYHGRLFGFDLSAVNPGSTIYISDAAAGAITATAPTTSASYVVAVGSVHVLTDYDETEFLFVDIPLALVPPTAIA